MPTRVIDVGKDMLRLVETGEDVRGEYVALSHCWGNLEKQERFCTYTNNIKRLKAGFSYRSLPKTFRDAITVTRALGIPYLWIDSLCIIQEDEKDWEEEAGKMEEIFSSSYCTIAADSAASSLAGFLNERLPRVCVSIETPRGPLYLAEAIDSFDADVENGILNSRGWVLQERVLSRRTIHFTSTQVYWECGDGIHCETLAHLRK